MRLIRIREVMKITGISRSYIYAMSHDGHFPKSVKLSKHSTAWVGSEVLAWVDSRIATRDSVL